MPSSYVQLGPLHIPVAGIFAALGVMGALTLSQYTARFAALSPEALWNTGMVAILAMFVSSRLLLIAFNFESFLRSPLLVLALSSVTGFGFLLTAIFMGAYVRWKRLPLLRLLDAAFPCAALLWAFLSLGEYFARNRDGMPSYSWGVAGFAGTRPQPVELATTFFAVFISVRLLNRLQKQHATRPDTAGTVTGVGFAACGLVVFFIDLFRLPSDLLPDFPLDPSQIIGVAMILAGAALLVRLRTQIERESGNEPPYAI